MLPTEGYDGTVCAGALKSNSRADSMIDMLQAQYVAAFLAGMLHAFFPFWVSLQPCALLWL